MRPGACILPAFNFKCRPVTLHLYLDAGGPWGTCIIIHAQFTMERSLAAKRSFVACLLRDACRKLACCRRGPCVCGTLDVDSRLLCKQYSSPRTGGFAGRAHPGHHCDSRTRDRSRGRIMPGVRSTPGLPHGGDARGVARGQPNLGEISAKPHLYERCIRVSVVLPA